jgi:hypothetical protein
MPKIILKITLVKQVILIVLLSLSTFLIVLELTLIKTTIGVANDSLTVALAVDKISVIVVLVGPVVVTLTVWHVLLESACVNLSVLETDRA